DNNNSTLPKIKTTLIYTNGHACGHDVLDCRLVSYNEYLWLIRSSTQTLHHTFDLEYTDLFTSVFTKPIQLVRQVLPNDIDYRKFLIIETRKNFLKIIILLYSQSTCSHSRTRSTMYYYNH